jgi:thioredoxin 1
MAEFIQDETEFDALLSGEKVLVVDYTATWCGPCKLVAPLIDRLATEYGESIPAVMFFKNGETVETIVGVKAYEEFSGALEKLLT